MVEGNDNTTNDSATGNSSPRRRVGLFSARRAGRGRVTPPRTEPTGDAEVDAGTPVADPGPHVALTVRDTGCGIPDDVLPRIFEPFVSTKTGSGGGLGLATVYGIVVRSGGTVTVETAVGEGTCISVLLPRHTAARAAPVAAPVVRTSSAAYARCTIRSIHLP